MIRTSVYIDGFNLYFGMTSAHRNVKWLNVEELAKRLLKSNQQLAEVKYFTANVSNDPPKEHRQQLYLDALRSTNTKLILGHYKSRRKRCRSCGVHWNQNEEKMTDVNIAVNLITDAMEDKYDTALLISGDSDLVPPINAVHRCFPNKRVVVAFPPNRHNNSVKNAAKGSFIIGRTKLTQSQFPDQIQKPNGYIIQKPSQW